MKLFFRKSGEGFPLIIIHGLFGMSDNWATLARAYAADGFTVYLPDLRNHGQSPHSDEFSMSLMADDLLELFEAESIQKAFVVGHSLGGKVAMQFACLYPEKVSKLVVSDIAPRYYPPHHDDVLEGIHAVDLSTIKSRSEAEQQMATVIKDEGTRQFLLKNLFWKEGADQEEKKLAWRFNLSVLEKKHATTGDALPENLLYNGPVLFIRGERSNYITAEDTSLIKKHFPKAEILTVPSAGHWVHADNPKDFSEVLLKFLKSTN
jgi:esterase